MLLVVGADATVVGTSKYCFRVGLPRVFRSFVVVPDLFVIIYVVGDQPFSESMRFALFCQKYFAVLKYDLGVNFPVAFVAKTDRVIIIDVVSFKTHGRQGWMALGQGNILFYNNRIVLRDTLFEWSLCRREKNERVLSIRSATGR